MLWRDRLDTPIPAAVTADPREIARFSVMADEWWDPKGRFGTLHRFNPIRIAYIRDRVCAHFGRESEGDAPFAALRLLDIGCGGGLLAEPMARMGAEVVAIDASAKLVQVARAHAATSGLAIDYRHALVEDLAAAGETFDVILNTEVIEHVANVDSFLDGCCAMMKPGGVMVVATLNRTLKSLLFAKIGGEYLLRLLPKGTHDWRRFVRPEELSAALTARGTDVREVIGVSYNPLTRHWRHTQDRNVNYMALAARPAA